MNKSSIDESVIDLSYNGQQIEKILTDEKKHSSKNLSNNMHSKDKKGTAVATNKKPVKVNSIPNKTKLTNENKTESKDKVKNNKTTQAKIEGSPSKDKVTEKVKTLSQTENNKPSNINVNFTSENFIPNSASPGIKAYTMSNFNPSPKTQLGLKKQSSNKLLNSNPSVSNPKTMEFNSQVETEINHNTKKLMGKIGKTFYQSKATDRRITIDNFEKRYNDNPYNKDSDQGNGCSIF